MNPALVKQQIANLRMSHPELVEDEEAWLLSLESETNLDELLRAIERKRQEVESLARAIAINIADLDQRLRRFERREQSMRDIAFKLMQAADVKKRELPEATLSITNGKPKVLILAENLLPDIAFRIKREPDKTKIRELLETEPFIVAGAALSNAEPHLTIRTK